MTHALLWQEQRQHPAKLIAVFIGHNALAFAAKRVAPRTSLGVLTAAAMLPDLIWPLFLILGVEHVRIRLGATLMTPLDFYDYPWTHSLVTTAGAGLLVAILYWSISRNGRGAVVVGFCVLSHWLLDFVVHTRDLPLFPGGGPKFGLGVWNHRVLSIVIESALFAASIVIYRDVTKARDRIGSIVFWAYVITLAAIYISSTRGVPPPNLRILEWMAVSGWLLPFWAAWFDRHREVTV